MVQATSQPEIWPTSSIYFHWLSADLAAGPAFGYLSPAKPKIPQNDLMQHKSNEISIAIKVFAYFHLPNADPNRLSFEYPSVRAKRWG